MAKNQSTVYLGYEDECVSDKHKSLIDYTTNKAGGIPNWANGDITVPPCPLCGLNRPLLVQIYAPLENSQFHRTLYIFVCLNPICSNQSRGWICIRSQVLEKNIEFDSGKNQSKPNSKINWCSGADEWDDFEDVSQDMDSINEQNGNVIRVDNRASDEDEESASMESELIPRFGSMNFDDKNANCGAQGGAVGRMNSPNASAEIEGEETEMITIDLPTAPQRDLIALLKHTPVISSEMGNKRLKSFFISVDVEKNQSTSLSEHVRDLLQEYQLTDEKKVSSPSSPSGNVAGGGGGGDCDNEQYEKGIPAHGDLTFHNFLSVIQQNPGQIIRYSRDALPLLVAPICEQVPKCQNCGGDVICELQILPTLIPKLYLESGESTPIEFGNALVYTCTQSCWDTPDKMRIELIIVQQES